MAEQQKIIPSEPKKGKKFLVAQLRQRQRAEMEQLRVSLGSGTPSLPTLSPPAESMLLLKDKPVDLPAQDVSTSAVVENVPVQEEVRVPLESPVHIQRLSSPVGVVTRGRKKKAQESGRTSRKLLAKKPKKVYFAEPPTEGISEVQMDLPTGSASPVEETVMMQTIKSTQSVKGSRPLIQPSASMETEFDNTQLSYSTDPLSPGTIERLEGRTVPVQTDSSVTIKDFVDKARLAKKVDDKFEQYEKRAEEERLAYISETAATEQDVGADQGLEPGEIAAEPPLSAASKGKGVFIEPPPIPEFEDFEKSMQEDTVPTASSKRKSDSSSKRTVTRKGKEKAVVKPTSKPTVKSGPRPAVRSTSTSRTVPATDRHPEWFPNKPGPQGPYWNQLQSASDTDRTKPSTIESLTEELDLYKKAYIEGIDKVYLDLNDVEKKRKLDEKKIEALRVATNFDNSRIKALLLKLDESETRRENSEKAKDKQIEDLQNSVADLRRRLNPAKNDPPQNPSQGPEKEPVADMMWVARDDYYKMFRDGGEDMLIAAARRDMVHPDILSLTDVISPSFQRHHELAVALYSTREHLKVSEVRRDPKSFPDRRDRNPAEDAGGSRHPYDRAGRGKH